ADNSATPAGARSPGGGTQHLNTATPTGNSTTPAGARNPGGGTQPRRIIPQPLHPGGGEQHLNTATPTGNSTTPAGARDPRHHWGRDTLFLRGHFLGHGFRILRIGQCCISG
ncbi:MAG: hypothetical protein K0U36_00855, partial [Alphaproteobacteria bacterium]|nr:hypothetical protein [Alphaproteobacteria bacterium]